MRNILISVLLWVSKFFVKSIYENIKNEVKNKIIYAEENFESGLLKKQEVIKSIEKTVDGKIKRFIIRFILDSLVDSIISELNNFDKSWLFYAETYFQKLEEKFPILR